VEAQTALEYLLAKSIKDGRRVTLAEHSLDTASAAQLIFSQDTRVGRNFCRAFKLDESSTAMFMLNLSVAALFHDIGKANEGFMQAIFRKPNAQVIRHEHLSALILQLPEISQWLKDSSIIRYDAIVAAVLSHHLKAAFGEIAKHPTDGFARHSNLHLNHSEVHQILDKVQELGQLQPAPKLNYPYYHCEKEPWESCIQRLNDESRRYRRTILRDAQEHQFVAALKCALIISDSVSSGVIRTGGNIADWIMENVHLPRLTKEELYEKIIDLRLANLQERSKDRKVSIHPFQDKAAQLGDRAMLVAGCGSGKTLAGLLWAANRLASGEYGRVLFLYPTRGTATEGFKDYIGWAPGDEAMLLHSSSDYVLEAIMENPPESAKDKDYRLAEDRLFSLANYRKRFFSATVDQFLSFLQHGYAGICMSVVFADSVVIIDEVHSFDQQLFNTLLAHLSHLEIPTLCMTATLQNERRSEISRCEIEVYPSEQDRQAVQDLVNKEEHPRYHFNSGLDVESLIQLAIKQVKEKNERILWVVNTVQRCQYICSELAKRLGCRIGESVIAYHSRFRTEDRERHHQDAVTRFRFDSASSGVIAVTTQVCEMSLDLDADRLISELAPIASLIQRCGRANRHESNRAAGFLADIHIYSPEFAAPYDNKDLKQSKIFVDDLTKDDAVSQRHLADCMMRHGTNPELGLKPQSLLFESGYFARPGDVRDIDEYTRPAILDVDVKRVHTLVLQKDPFDAFVVPVPERFAIKSNLDWLPGYLSIASSAQYCEELGFLNEVKVNA
jgi:CRISPR-associated endonuclease/helicase Cas3